MICQKCNQKPANVEVTQTMNNKKTVVYLCEACAGVKQEFFLDNSFNMGSLLSGIIGNAYNISKVAKTENVLKCKKCGMTFEEFCQIGRFGCAECYLTFESKLEQIFRRLQGSDRHKGKIPVNRKQGKTINDEITELKKALQLAIKNEQYEKAAVFRDKIKDLEAMIKKAGEDG